MKREKILCLQKTVVFGILFFTLALFRPLHAEPTTSAIATFNAYCQNVENRLNQQHLSSGTFLARSSSPQRLRNGELILEQLTPAKDSEFSGSMLHHWRGTAFASGARATDFDRLMRNFNAYPQSFSPQVIQAWNISSNNNFAQAYMRVRQKHVLTVVMDMTFDILYTRPDSTHGYSIARSTRIAEIESPGTTSEHALSPSEDHGYLWRQNTYWSYEERDGGLYMQVESITLTRDIPRGLGWAIGPYIQSIPRESLEFTLHATRDAIKK